MDATTRAPITKETLHARLLAATTVAELDALEQDARPQGYSDHGVFLTALRARRAELGG